MSSSERHILVAYACIMRRTRHCHGLRGTYPVLGKIMLAGSSATLILADISSMRHLHVASRQSFLFAWFCRSILWLWGVFRSEGVKECPVNLIMWLRQRSWLAELFLCLSNGIFTSLFLGQQYFHPPSNYTKKSNLLVFDFHTSYHSVGMLLGWYHLCVYCMKSTFEKGRNKFKKSWVNRIESFLLLSWFCWCWFKILSTSAPHQRHRRWYFSLI